MNRIALAAATCLFLGVAAGCVGASQITIRAYDDAYAKVPNLTCGQIKAEQDENKSHMRQNQHSLNVTARIYYARPRLNDLMRMQRKYHKLLITEYEDRCVQGRQTLQDQRIDHVDEKLDIEREERRHGELIDAIRDN